MSAIIEPLTTLTADWVTWLKS